MSISEDFSRFTYGGFASEAIIYDKINGSYQIVYSENFGATIYGGFVDEINGLYYTFYSSDGNMRLYFGCPDACSSCSFPNNCSSCSPGFQINGVTCEPIPIQTSPANNQFTHCVKNQFQIQNVCQ